MVKLSRSVLLGVSLVVGSVAAGPVFAQAWPARAVQLVTPFPPGGGGDILMRTLANKLQERLGKPFIVDNRPGAGGLIGTQYGAKAAPDGYSVTLGITSTYSINPTFYKTLPYDPLKDFQPVALLAEGPHLMVINPDTPAKNFKEYVEYVRTQKGKLSYASYGNGSTSQLINEMLNSQHGMDLVHVPYKGMAAALTDVMANRVSMLLATSAPAVPLVQSGKLRAVAVFGNKRIETLPDVPTIGELGYKDSALQIWYGLFAPAGTPRPIVEKFNAELRSILALKDVQESFDKAGLYANPLGVDEFAAYVHSEAERWGKLVRLSKVQAD